jgi:hypothetical protein
MRCGGRPVWRLEFWTPQVSAKAHAYEHLIELHGARSGSLLLAGTPCFWSERMGGRPFVAEIP